MTVLAAVIIFFAVSCVVLFVIAKAQIKRADKEQKRAETLHKALGTAQWKAERLQQALNKQTSVEAKVNEQKQALSSTADTDLVHRANDLFRMQNH
jgi:hypothetical protein